ncbi:POLIIIAc domain-containing protein [Citrus sinensis]|nr:POLIIIAc domain-containing protein [Citrus sinensis]
MAHDLSVHILAYYSSCGPSKYEELENLLGNIRDGRFLRAKDMILKLNKLKLPLKWENVAKIAGKGVAPGRLHVARAMVEAGHVENLKHAFADISMMGDMHTPRNEPVGVVEKYETDYKVSVCCGCRGSQPLAEVVVELIHRTSGLAVLAHPWALKNPAAIIRKLKDVGLHGLEVYRSDGKLVGVIFTLQDGSHYESKKEIESIVLEILCSIIYLMRESEFESQFLL